MSDGGSWGTVGPGRAPDGALGGAAASTPAAPPGFYPLGDGRTAWWDGVQWHASAPVAPVDPYRPISGLTTAVVALLSICGIVSVLGVLTELRRVQLMNQVIDRPYSVTQESLDAADVLAISVAVADVLLLLVSGIVFLVWLNRTFKNLQGPLRAGRLEYTPGWAVGWWFVPLANFVKPKLVMNEAWAASDPGSPDPRIAPSYASRRTPPALLSWWWGMWIGAGLCSNLAGLFSSDELSPSAESLRSEFLASAFGNAVYAVAAVLAVLVVRQVAARHEARFQNLTARSAWGG